MKKLFTGLLALMLAASSVVTSYALTESGADDSGVSISEYAYGESHSYNGFLYYDSIGPEDNIAIGQTETVTFRNPPPGCTLEWTSSNPSCISVDENGNITGISEGTARISCSTTYIGYLVYDYLDIRCVGIKTGIYKIHNSNDKGYLTISDYAISDAVEPRASEEKANKYNSLNGQMWRIQYAGGTYTIRPYSVMDFCLRSNEVSVGIKHY